jgi:hypothetical protein
VTVSNDVGVERGSRIRGSNGLVRFDCGLQEKVEKYSVGLWDILVPVKDHRKQKIVFF